MTAIEFNYQITNLQVHLKSFALKLTSNDVDSEDLVQETTLKALRFRDKFVDSSNLKAWLFTIMKNTYINDYRKKKRASTFLEEAAVVARMRMGSAADCGSVEFLYTTTEGDSNSSDPRPLYFDFNLLSTLPDKIYYDQLAEFILRDV